MKKLKKKYLNFIPLVLITLASSCSAPSISKSEAIRKGKAIRSHLINNDLGNYFYFTSYKSSKKTAYIGGTKYEDEAISITEIYYDLSNSYSYLKRTISNSANNEIESVKYLYLEDENYLYSSSGDSTYTTFLKNDNSYQDLLDQYILEISNEFIQRFIDKLDKLIALENSAINGIVTDDITCSSSYSSLGAGSLIISLSGELKNEVNSFTYNETTINGVCSYNRELVSSYNFKSYLYNQGFYKLATSTYLDRDNNLFEVVTVNSSFSYKQKEAVKPDLSSYKSI